MLSHYLSMRENTERKCMRTRRSWYTTLHGRNTWNIMHMTWSTTTKGPIMRETFGGTRWGDWDVPTPYIVTWHSNTGFTALQDWTTWWKPLFFKFMRRGLMLVAFFATGINHHWATPSALDQLCRDLPDIDSVLLFPGFRNCRVSLIKMKFRISANE